jgi:DNA-binding CsgD family transcriptional regulator
MPPRRAAETIERDHKAYDLYRRGQSYRQIGAELGISHQAASNAVRRAAKENAVDPLEAAAGRQVFLDRIQDYRRAALAALLACNYVTTQAGRLAEGPDGLPQVDTDPNMRALDRLTKLDDMELRLKDYYPPARSRVEIVDEDVAIALAEANEREIARLAEEAAAHRGDGVTGDPPETL